MENYLGEKSVDLKISKFSKYRSNDWVMLYIAMYGEIDGSHHKDWLIDQVAKILNGTKVLVTEASWGNGHSEYRFKLDEPSKKYLAWRKEIEGEPDEDGCLECDYDEGIAP